VFFQLTWTWTGIWKELENNQQLTWTRTRTGKCLWTWTWTWTGKSFQLTGKSFHFSGFQTSCKQEFQSISDPFSFLLLFKDLTMRLCLYETPRRKEKAIHFYCIVEVKQALNRPRCWIEVNLMELTLISSLLSYRIAMF